MAVGSSGVKYNPKFGRVLIRREVQQKIGSIIIADPKRHARCEGTVVALGETAGWAETYDYEGNRIPIQTLQVGNKVIFGRHSGAWLDASYGNDGKEQDDGTLFICQDADILLVIDEVA